MKSIIHSTVVVLNVLLSIGVLVASYYGSKFNFNIHLDFGIIGGIAITILLNRIMMSSHNALIENGGLIGIVWGIIIGTGLGIIWGWGGGVGSHGILYWIFFWNLALIPILVSIVDSFITGFTGQRRISLVLVIIVLVPLSVFGTFKVYKSLPLSNDQGTYESYWKDFSLYIVTSLREQDNTLINKYSTADVSSFEKDLFLQSNKDIATGDISAIWVSRPKNTSVDNSYSIVIWLKKDNLYHGILIEKVKKEIGAYKVERWLNDTIKCENNTFPIKITTNLVTGNLSETDISFDKIKYQIICNQ